MIDRIQITKKRTNPLQRHQYTYMTSLWSILDTHVIEASMPVERGESRMSRGLRCVSSSCAWLSAASYNQALTIYNKKPK